MDKMIVSIISHEREYNIEKMQQLLENFECHWFVNKGDGDSYIKSGAKNVHECGRLVQNRNEALKYSWSQGQDCIQTDDDLEKIQIAVDRNSRHNKDITFTQMIHILYDGFNQTGLRFKLAGVPATINNFFFNPEKPISTKHFIVGNVMIIKNCDLYFDKALQLKEDYDYTLQHITTFGGVIRCDNIMADYKHWTNKGGCTTYRNEDLEYDSVQYLKEKWGDLVRDNPKRKNRNEILLKIPR